jgi:hypothetical protein
VTEIAAAMRSAGQTSPNRAYWSSADGQQYLRRYFERAGSTREAATILDSVLRIARGDRAMYERQAREVSNFLLAVLTHPYSAAVATAEFPDLARRLRPVAIDVIRLDTAKQVAIGAALAHQLGEGRRPEALDVDSIVSQTLDEIDSRGDDSGPSP